MVIGSTLADLSFSKRRSASVSSLVGVCVKLSLPDDDAAAEALPLPEHAAASSRPKTTASCGSSLIDIFSKWGGSYLLQALSCNEHVQ